MPANGAHRPEHIRVLDTAIGERLPNRYHVWRWLKTNQGTLEEAIAESGSRLQVDRAEAARLIRRSTRPNGTSARTTPPSSSSQAVTDPFPISTSK